MAPSMRARSANNTPVKGQDTFASEIDTLATPTRKVPHCSKCKRPRAGHPRSGCPFVTPTDENGSDRSSTNLSDALGSITLDGQETPPRKTPARRAGRQRRRSEKATALAHSQTLQSLSDSDLEALLLPAGRDVSDDEKGGETEEEDHWNDRIEMLSAGGNIPTRAIMPGTLVTPSPWSSFASIPEENKHGIVQTSSPSNASFSSTETISVEIVSPSSTTAPRPLARTMSMEERAGFIAHLEELSSAKAYVLSRADLTELRGRAPKGLYTRFLMDEEAGRNVLVVGRDELDTERLYQTLDAEKQQTMYATRGVSMKSAAGGAVVGAVATFTGLAFA
ncbi:hypothetical protein EV368DRAFT_35801 [Lentinula lateritia]|nr:hypothetical protein EV368DRAFT_35801 [Lentinula lateritia]